MYLSMTEQDYEEVIKEARIVVAKRLGISVDREPVWFLRSAIRCRDSLAADLLDKFIEVYTDWWKASCSTTQGESDSKETIKRIKLLIDRRGLMRTALMSYLNSLYPSPRHEL